MKKIILLFVVVMMVIGCATNVVMLEYIPNQDILIQGGVFSMGNSNFYSFMSQGDIEGEQGKRKIENLDHPVFLDDFYLSKYEVTVKDYMAFVNETKTNYPCWQQNGSLYNLETGINKKFKKTVSYLVDNHPIIGVTWFNAINYCNWKSEKSGLEPCYEVNEYNVSYNPEANGYRLPTEAEWEFAARGGMKSKYYQYSGDNKPEKVAWIILNSLNKLHIIGQKQPNELNLHDMSGNVREWCWDYYSNEYYKDFKKISNIIKIENPTGPVFGSERTLRGGGWKSQAIATTTRSKESPEKCDVDIGFRIARSK